MKNDIFIVNWNKCMINMWITSTIYFDFSDVFMYSLFMLSNSNFNFWFWNFIVYTKHVDYYNHIFWL